MRIVYDHHAFSMQKYGGISRYFSRLFEGIADRGFETHIVAPLYRSIYLREDGGNVHGRRIKNYIRGTSSIINIVNNYISRPKIKKLNANIYHQTFYGETFKCKSKKIITVYDFIHEKYKNLYKNSDCIIENKRNKIINSDHIICISENTKKDLMELIGVEEDRISVIYLGFEKSQSREHKKIFDYPYILYVGSRWGYKNYKNFITAYAISNNLKKTFKVVCAGGGKFNQGEINLHKSLGIDSGNVVYIEATDKVLWSPYKYAAGLIYPPLYEGFGLPVLEAMAVGCPVFCGKTSSLPEIVGENELFFNPLAIDEIRNVMEQNLFDGNIYSNEYKNRLILNANAFSWDKCCSETLDLYKKIL